MEGGGTVYLISTDDLIDESPLDTYTSRMGSVKIENALMPMPEPVPSAGQGEGQVQGVRTHG